MADESQDYVADEPKGQQDSEDYLLDDEWGLGYGEIGPSPGQSNKDGQFIGGCLGIIALLVIIPVIIVLVVWWDSIWGFIGNLITGIMRDGLALIPLIR